LLRWLTSAETGLLDMQSPANPDFATELQALRDRRTEVPVSQGLQPGLAAMLDRLLAASPSGLRLHLAEDLSAEWHHFPFQWLHYRGETLHGRLLVASDTPYTVDPPIHSVCRDGVGAI